MTDEHIDSREIIRLLILAYLVELSGKLWTVELKCMEWDFHYIAQCQNIKRITEWFNLTEPINILDDAETQAKIIYYSFKMELLETKGKE